MFKLAEHISNCDITGNISGRGIDIEKTSSAAYELTDIQIVNNTIDSNAKEGIFLNGIRNSQIDSNWVSSGRTAGADGIDITNSESLVISQNQLFWNGHNGRTCSSCNFMSITANLAESNQYAGIGLAVTTNSTISSNATWSNTSEGAGANQQYGIIDYGSSNGNSFIGNKASTNTVLNYWFAGTNETVYQ